VVALLLSQTAQDRDLFNFKQTLRIRCTEKLYKRMLSGCFSEPCDLCLPSYEICVPCARWARVPGVRIPQIDVNDVI
jgi:hypothetical protein